MDYNSIHQQRITAVRQKLSEWEVEAVLITSPTNRRWLSGFTGSNGQLLITADQALIATDFRYFTQAANEAADFTLFKHQRTLADTQALLQQAAVARVGVEAQHVTLAQMDDLNQVDDVSWVSLPTTLEPMRMVKTAVEVETIQKAAVITDAVMAQVPRLAQIGMSEAEVAWQLEKAMRQAGAGALAFDVIVASGPNSGLPHHHPGSRRLQAGDALIVDMGAQVDGYKSDLTRSFFIGEKATAHYFELYHLVLKAHTAVFQQAKPGMRLKKVDSLARDIIHGAGHAEHFGHGLGHGLGLDIHEDPLLSVRAPEGATLEVGTVVTIEPGCYIPNWGGIRIEDLALVTADGLISLSHCPKQPNILDMTGF
ncbi:Aminopeptidase YpdF (MP-, MA-, MS-, AP-, NP-specific) [hydrothermal vent metagenome]|uniref:Aminopeptidase YpdF (MP-, MA-, MS-, AP-, NP-specific) n=1 Tax=hydrothermal vent metagenome TaxID=652676 RepID=A0A3B0VPL1_9ZZZZ